MKFSIFVASVFLFSSFSLYAEKSPEELSSTCLGCHGVVSYNNIYPTYKVPKLGNQHKDYIVAALKAYRSGERSHTTMKAHAANLSDLDIDKIADYFSSFKTKIATPENTLQGSSAEVDGSEGKFTANIVYEGFKDLNTIKRHKLVYNSLDSYIKSGELHAISLKTYANTDEIS